MTHLLDECQQYDLQFYGLLWQNYVDGDIFKLVTAAFTCPSI